MLNSAGGSINIFCKNYSETAEEINWWATDGDLKVSSAKQIAFNSGDKVVLHDYSPPEKDYFNGCIIEAHWADKNKNKIEFSEQEELVHIYVKTKNTPMGELVRIEVTENKSDEKVIHYFFGIVDNNGEAFLKEVFKFS